LGHGNLTLKAEFGVRNAHATPSHCFQAFRSEIHNPHFAFGMP
jgi:tetrahydromethanopterin S-methyltransferase subunit E